MAVLTLVLYLLFVGVLFGLRSVVMRSRTGSSGWRGISGRPGSAEWLGGVLFALALLLGLAAPICDLAGVATAIDALDRLPLHVLGLLLVAAGTALSLAAQLAMGDSWRVGVQEGERTELVTDGPYAVVRNPFFAALLPAAVGFALLVPNVVALLALLALIVALELQTRVVEEPYLLRAHGATYADYAARVGRFAPALGRLRASRR
ncbi:MAG TPA: isoprenylcysteine carboxylmethyltransferase family protein [Conexibacter sp.]|nr:isoprenylcysteine carboxylmethyltransferase family protein [Conexibacter sp.]